MMNVSQFIDILWAVVGVHIVLTWILAVRRGWKARRSEVKEPEVRMSELPGVSVIVPAWNEKGTIERCIEALKQVDYPEWEAIIVAGGTDGTYEAAEQANGGDGRFRLVERGAEPKNTALAKGIQNARHEIVVLLDCDNMVTPGWLKALMSPMARGANVAVGNSHANRDTWITQEEQMWNILTYQILKLSWIQGDRSIAIRKSLLEKIGGLPIHTYAREDWDIWARLDETNGKVAFAEQAHLTTDRPATLGEHWKHQVRWRRTHLTGLLEMRSRLVKQPGELFRQIYGYLLSIILVVLAITALGALLLLPSLAGAALDLLVLYLVWVCLRQGSVAGSVAGFTGDLSWLAKAWMPMVNQLLLMGASLVALVTYSRLEPHYKGARHFESSLKECFLDKENL